MISSSIILSMVLLVCLVGVGVVAQRPVDHATVEMFSDRGCTKNITEALVIQGPFARRCQPDEARTSHIHYCAEESGMIRYAYNVWQPSGDCSGDARMSLSSFGYNGRCAQGTVNRGGGTVDVFMRVQCVFGPSMSATKHSQLSQVKGEAQEGGLSTDETFQVIGQAINGLKL